MNKCARFLHLALCLMVIFTVNSNTAFSNEFCPEDTIREENYGELGQHVMLNDILEPLKILTGPLLIQKLERSLKTPTSSKSDDKYSLRTSGTSPPKL